MIKIVATKYRKYQKVRVLQKDIDYKRVVLLYGLYGLKCLEGGRITSGQLESLQRTIKKYIKKLGFLWLRILPDRSITAKPAEVRMGKGKGNVSDNVAIVMKGSIILELGGSKLPSKIALTALRYASQKIGLKTAIVMFKN